MVSTLDCLVKGFEQCRSDDFWNKSRVKVNDFFNGFDGEISSNDVENFSMKLSDYRSELGDGSLEANFRAGFFLSGMIQKSENFYFNIHTRNLGVPLGFIGYHNEKNVTIDGDVGSNLGYHMKGGMLNVKGNAGNYAGIFLEFGDIFIEGDAGIQLGHGMEGGKVVVGGNAERESGMYMGAGKIMIKGNAKGYDGFEMRGGEVLIEGDVLGGNVGQNLRGGRVLVKGNAGGFVGSGMSGGEVFVMGNAGAYIGHSMTGGMVYLRGDYPLVELSGVVGSNDDDLDTVQYLSDNIQGGDIYYQGKRIVEDGKNL